MEVEGFCSPVVSSLGGVAFTVALGNVCKLLSAIGGDRYYIECTGEVGVTVGIGRAAGEV